MIWMLLGLCFVEAEPDNVIIQYLYRPKNCEDIGKSGDTLHVQYLGRFYDSRVKFDSSYDRNNVPFKYQLEIGGVIEGYQIGTKNMCINERRRLIVPSKYAYGAHGTGNIPGYSTLMFDVHLVQINDKPPNYPVPIEDAGDIIVVGQQECEHPIMRADVVTITYIGTLTDGTVFDNQTTIGLSFVVGERQIMMGIEEGIVSYCKDSLIQLEIPPIKAYGDRWDGPVPQWSYVYYNVTVTEHLVRDTLLDNDKDLHCSDLVPPEKCRLSYKIQQYDYITLGYKIMADGMSGEMRYPVGRGVYVSGWDKAILGSCVGQHKLCWIPETLAHRVGAPLFLTPSEKGFWCSLEVKKLLLTNENRDEYDLQEIVELNHFERAVLYHTEL